MIHPDTDPEQIIEAVGLGVVVTARIPKGTITWAMDPLDRRIRRAELAKVPQQLSSVVWRYTWLDVDGSRILCWDHGRYLNHSCDPNCGGTDLRFEVALRDIEPGEQLTNDYRTLRLEPEEDMACDCGSLHCSGHITGALSPDKAERLAGLVRDALTRSPSVEQPLGFLVSAARIRSAAAGKWRVRSVGTPAASAAPEAP